MEIEIMVPKMLLFMNLQILHNNTLYGSVDIFDSMSDIEIYKYTLYNDVMEESDAVDRDSYEDWSEKFVILNVEMSSDETHYCIQ